MKVEYRAGIKDWGGFVNIVQYYTPRIVPSLGLSTKLDELGNST